MYFWFVIVFSFGVCCEDIKSTCDIERRSIQILGFVTNGGDGIGWVSTSFSSIIVGVFFEEFNEFEDINWDIIFVERSNQISQKTNYFHNNQTHMAFYRLVRFDY